MDGILLEVQDFGIGIHKNDLQHLFKRFFRARNVSNISGTGLGLSIAKELVELHKGEIFIESTLGEGSIVRVFLPN